MTKDDFPIAEAEEKIGYVFKDKNLLIEAFTHVPLAKIRHLSFRGFGKRRVQIFS